MKVCGDIKSGIASTQSGSRLANFLGEVRREKNGAVADYMRFYGAKYGLNYGVSLPTIRKFAREESLSFTNEENYKFAKLLYRQEVRELRLSALYIADIKLIKAEDLQFWADGIINSEVAEEAAFALFSRSDLSDVWLDSGVALLQYCAVMAMAKRCDTLSVKAELLLDSHRQKLSELVENEPHLVPKAIVVLLDSLIKLGVKNELIQDFLLSLSDSSSSNFIREELAWRMEFR